jgi:hypothetical protein
MCQVRASSIVGIDRSRGAGGRGKSSSSPSIRTRLPAARPSALISAAASPCVFSTRARRATSRIAAIAEECTHALELRVEGAYERPLARPLAAHVPELRRLRAVARGDVAPADDAIPP